MSMTMMFVQCHPLTVMDRDAEPLTSRVISMSSILWYVADA